MGLNSAEGEITTEARLYLRAEQQVTKELPELLFWMLVDKKVLSVHIEKSPVKSEGDILYIKPGTEFNAALSPLEEMFRMPFQTRIAGRLKWKNYVPQLLRLLKNPTEVEKKYIFPELKKKGFQKRSWLDQLLNRKKAVFLPAEYGTVFEQKIEKAKQYKAQYKQYVIDSEWDIW